MVVMSVVQEDFTKYTNQLLAQLDADGVSYVSNDPWAITWAAYDSPFVFTNRYVFECLLSLLPPLGQAGPGPNRSHRSCTPVRRHNEVWVKLA